MATGRSNSVAAGRLGSLFSLGAAGGLTDGQLLERFLSRDDPAAAEAAFTALVDRHGALVLNVCRRELRDPHDAHDAFQATFLVLVSKASALRHWETVGGWLVGIARRVTARARVDRARRRRHLEQLGIERNVLGDGPAAEGPAEPDVDYAPLIDEVSRLPERFRAPVVLHYLEGLSTEATAQRLGCARGTVLSRLSRARHRLKQRLERRGVAPAVLIPVGGVEPARWLPPIQVPAWLAQGTIRAAGSLGLAGAAIESVVPATVAKLSRRVARTLTLSRVGVGAALLLVAAAGVSIGLAATLGQDPKPRGGPAMERPRGAMDRPPAARGDRDAKSELLIVPGRVLDPSGEPVSGAEVVLSVPKHRLDAEIRRLGTTGPDGRFEVSVPRADIEPPARGSDMPFTRPVIAAIAPGLGPDWSEVDPKKAGEAITLNLRHDDVPIEGRVISLEGRPIPGLSVKVGYIGACPPALLSKLRENAGKMNPELWGEMRNVFIPEGKGALRPVQTGADGRFRVTGVGRDRAAFLMIEGGPIEQSFAMVFTSGDRGYRPILLPRGGPDERKLEGPRFEMAVAPGREIEGTVRDRDTGQPISGAKITSWFGTAIPGDAQGRFRLAGQSKGRENHLTVTVEDQPYVKVVKPLNDSGGIAPVRLDIPLKRGVWAEGRVTDRATGKPVKAVVVYYPFRDNPNVNDCPDASFLNDNVSDEAECPTDADGRFRAAVLPGGGLLTVRATEPGYPAAKPLDGRTAGNVLHAAGNFQYDMDPYHALIPIEAPADKTLVVPDIALTAGRTQHIRIVGPDGRPVAGARVFCLQDASFGGDPLAGDELTFHHATPGKGETIVFVHESRALGAAVELRGDEPDPVRVALQPTGSVSGRLVDEEGRPRPEVGLAVEYYLRTRGSTVGAERFEPLTSGPDGRFRIRNLVPGVSYAVEAIKKNEMNQSFRAEGYLQKTRWTVKTGETQDWGDVQVKAYRR
jgi:RNA polymerase sigma factor (sigma-70 family)